MVVLDTYVSILMQLQYKIYITSKCSLPSPISIKMLLSLKFDMLIVSPLKKL